MSTLPLISAPRPFPAKIQRGTAPDWEAGRSLGPRSNPWQSGACSPTTVQIAHCPQPSEPSSPQLSTWNKMGASVLDQVGHIPFTDRCTSESHHITQPSAELPQYPFSSTTLASSCCPTHIPLRNTYSPPQPPPRGKDGFPHPACISKNPICVTARCISNTPFTCTYPYSSTCCTSAASDRAAEPGTLPHHPPSLLIFYQSVSPYPPPPTSPSLCWVLGGGTALEQNNIGTSATATRRAKRRAAKKQQVCN
jgi:hypothetical protein